MMAFPDQEGIVAYFSMEIALLADVPTYSGGLGVLAGDTLRSAADLGLPLSAVTLLHRKGYFRQHLDADGIQTEEDQPWDVEKVLALQEPVVEVAIEGRQVRVRAWRYDLEGVTGHVVPVYLLDTDFEENDPRDRTITDHLYGGNSDYRLYQEAVLGLGGVLILEALGLQVRVYHMNEGHAALLTAGLMSQRLGGNLSRTPEARDREAVRSRCVFTTHTPVPAGHDHFTLEQTERILGREMGLLLEHMGGRRSGLLNMTELALVSSRFTNAVAMQHGKISREMFPQHQVEAITNGVHAATWMAPAMQELADRNFPLWRTDNFQLRYLIGISPEEIALAHNKSKARLIQEVAARSGVGLRQEVFTIGFARRVATYKRADLLFSDPGRLARCAANSGGLQILYAGKAHPHDEPAKELIHRIFEIAAEVNSEALKIVYLENYDWNLGALLTSGADLWLNTPQRPYEASGTSGMKAALNGVPSLSILDGWWVEGCIPGFTGWAIPDLETEEQEAAALYDHLESTILPLYYGRPDDWRKIMRSTAALNGSFFNTHRMLGQYIADAYYPQKKLNISSSPLEWALAR